MKKTIDEESYTRGWEDGYRSGLAGSPNAKPGARTPGARTCERVMPPREHIAELRKAFERMNREEQERVVEKWRGEIDALYREFAVDALEMLR